MLMPAVSHYMTKSPHTIARNATVAEARRAMHGFGIRHIPVVDASGLCGVVSERDLDSLEIMDNIDPETARVSDAMIERPFVATADTALDEILDVMSEHKYGSVVVVGRDGVEGIFTTVDACRVLADVLRRTAE